MPREFSIEPGSRILISRTDKLGDLVLALPFIESMKLRYPDCNIEVLASLYASPILENNPRIDRIERVQNDLLVKDSLYRKDLLRRLRVRQYSTVVALFPEKNVTRLFYAAGIPHRIGTAGRFHSVYFSHRLMHSRKSNRKHESEYNLDFLEFFRPGETVLQPQVFPTEKELANAQRRVAAAGITGKYIVVHPGSGGSAHIWPMDRFVALADIVGNAELPVLMTGSDTERALIEPIARRLGIKSAIIAGETDLRALVAILARASLVIANSTGPLHVAAAVGTKVIGIYPSKTIMSPVRWGPLGQGHLLIQPENAGCQCPSAHCRCMETITVERVAAVVRKATASLVPSVN